MKITTKEGTVFEGTQAEYEAFLAFVGRNLSEQEAKTAAETTEAVEELTFEGAKYRKVGREAQAGDVVVSRDNTSCCLENGKPYLAENRCDEIQVDAGERDFYSLYFELYGRSPETIDVYEKVESKYVPQDGDIVVVTGNTSCSENKVGDIGKITKIGKYNRVKVEVPGKAVENIWTKNGEFRKATPAEVGAYEKALADASKPKLKAGDFVTIDTDRFSAGITPDKAYEVFENSDGLHFIDNGEYKRYKPLAVGAYTIVGPYDAKWAKIGREIGEFRKGDIVCAENFIVLSEDIDSHIGVIEDVGGKLVGIRYANGQYCAAHKRNNNVKLIAPVEATFK